MRLTTTPWSCPKLLCLLFMSTSLTALSATPALPDANMSFDVAAIDHDRILKAANEALTVEPITITKYRAN